MVIYWLEQRGLYMTKLMQITDESAWLDKRKNYVTSTETAALYGLSPYRTYFELFHIKRGNIEEVREDNNFLLFGNLMEDVICQMILKEHPDWTILPMRVFAYDDNDKIGSSFDRVVTIPDKGTGLLEIKTISYKKFKETYIEDGDYIEASQHYEIQMQTELEVLNKYDWILQVPFLADTRTLKYVFRDRDQEMGSEIRKAVKQFWSLSEPPEPDFSRDKSLIAKLAPSLQKDKSLDATENQRITELAAMYLSSKQLEKQEADNADKYYAELMHLLGDNNYAWTSLHKISVSDIKATAKRSAYKRLTISEINKGD